MDDSQITTETVMKDYIPPEESSTRKRRTRNTAQSDSEPATGEPQKRTRSTKKISNPAAIRKDFNAVIARLLVFVGASPEKIYAQPPEPDQNLYDPTYTPELQPYLLPPSAAERIATLTDKINSATEGKIEKVKNSKIGILWSAVMAVVETAKTLNDLGKLIVDIRSQNAPTQTGEAPGGSPENPA